MAYSTNVSSKARFEFSTPCSDEATENGKFTSTTTTPFVVVPNLEMLDEIFKEKSRLRNYAIFFLTIELDKCPPHKFMDNWFHNFWNNKLGFNISFCQQIQKGLYVIFFINPDSYKEVLKKNTVLLALLHLELWHGCQK